MRKILTLPGKNSAVTTWQSQICMIYVSSRNSYVVDPGVRMCFCHSSGVALAKKLSFKNVYRFDFRSFSTQILDSVDLERKMKIGRLDNIHSFGLSHIGLPSCIGGHKSVDR